MGKGNKKNERDSSGLCGFFFVKPREGNAKRFAKKLLDMEGVKEVMLTTGEYGFVVKTRMKDENAHQTMAKAIAKNVGDCSIAVSHVNYRRGEL